MKKKLLITLGDSFTEGVGCYDYSKPEETWNILNEYQQNRFHELGWPNRLGKKLNYDKVINLGWGGSANSAHVKLFVEKILPKDFSDYDVLVVWMLTSAERFSFHSHGCISQYLPNLVASGEPGSPLEVAYVNTIDDLENDSILETIFYIKCLEQICENNSYNLLITSWIDSSHSKIKKLYNSKYLMKEVDGNPIAYLPNREDEAIYISKVCNHPNELGYEKIACNMIESIEKYNSYLINKNKVQNFEWEWSGNPTHWKFSGKNNII